MNRHIFPNPYLTLISPLLSESALAFRWRRLGCVLRRRLRRVGKMHLRRDKNTNTWSLLFRFHNSVTLTVYSEPRVCVLGAIDIVNTHKGFLRLIFSPKRDQSGGSRRGFLTMWSVFLGTTTTKWHLLSLEEGEGRCGNRTTRQTFYIASVSG